MRCAAAVCSLLKSMLLQLFYHLVFRPRDALARGYGSKRLFRKATCQLPLQPTPTALKRPRCRRRQAISIRVLEDCPAPSSNRNLGGCRFCPPPPLHEDGAPTGVEAGPLSKSPFPTHNDRRPNELIGQGSQQPAGGERGTAPTQTSYPRPRYGGSHPISWNRRGIPAGCGWN